MFKSSMRLLVFGLLALLAAGCITGSRSVAVTAVMNTTGQEMILPDLGSQVPAIQLEFAGTTVSGLQSEYLWLKPDGTGGGGANLAPHPLGFPGTLTARVGQSIHIVTTPIQLLPTLVIMEFDRRGVPAASSVLHPEAEVTDYPLANSGPYILQVTAQWSIQNYVTYLFALDVKP